METFSISSVVCAAALLAACLCPIAKADDWDKKTVVTFAQDVEIPGQVLPAGTYVFKLMRSESNRNIVQVWIADESLLVTTLMTVGDSYPNPASKPYFVLDMSGTDEGYPPTLVSWFFGNGDDGRDFIYSGYSTSRMVTDQANTAPPPEPEPPPQPAPEDNSSPAPQN
jgi:hypothetical protein